MPLESSPIYPALIEVNHISKKFSTGLKRSQYLGLSYLFKDLFGLSNKTEKLRTTEFWALKDVSFTVNPGEVVGIIGHNGAGKTTLLRVIAGLFKPTDGYVRREGRVSTIFAGTSGMDGMLTGKENIYIRAAVIGISREQVDEKIQEIIDFTELGEFIDAPLGTYSSGMKARLAFAVNITFPAEIFIIDEGLAVGDRVFKKKCINKIQEIKTDRIILNVSHSPFILKSMCNRIIVLEKGQVVLDSPDIDKGIEIYLGAKQESYADSINSEWNIENFSVDKLIIEDLSIIEAEEDTKLEVTLRVFEENFSAKLWIGFKNFTDDSIENNQNFSLDSKEARMVEEGILQWQIPLNSEYIANQPKLIVRVKNQGNLLSVGKADPQVLIE